MAHPVAFVPSNSEGDGRAYPTLRLFCALPPGMKLLTGLTFEVKPQSYQTTIARNPGYNYTISYNRRRKRARGRGRGGSRAVKLRTLTLLARPMRNSHFHLFYLQLQPLRSHTIDITIAITLHYVDDYGSTDPTPSLAFVSQSLFPRSYSHYTFILISRLQAPSLSSILAVSHFRKPHNEKRLDR